MPANRYLFRMTGGMPVVTPPAQKNQNYQAHLAGHAIGETVGRAMTFLTLTGANTASAPAAGAGTRR